MKKVLDSFENFLRLSATNEESVDDGLREHIHVETGLESAVKEAVKDNRPIVIAGTAGSGKTHLLTNAVSSSSGYTVILDLTDTPERDWPQLFDKKRKIVVAGNEGAFLLGKKKGVPGFDVVIDCLHAIQSGNFVSGEKEIMVIDAAGFDVASQHVISKLLSLDILNSFIEVKANDSFKDSWKMLSNNIVRTRVSTLIEIASTKSNAESFTFRQLWQFLSDIVLGSDFREPWFWRFFFGDSEISKQIRAVFPVGCIALPHVGNRLWHGDLNKLEPLFLPQAHKVLHRLIPTIIRTQDEDQRLRIFQLLRFVSLFGLKDSPVDEMLKQGNDLWSQIVAGQHRGLLKAINKYFSFGLLELGDDLKLWMQHDTERRQRKPNVQISIGTALANQFEITKSFAVGNPPKGYPAFFGGRLLLKHKSSLTTLFLTKDLVEGLVKSRSHKSNDRKDIEYDWRLSSFFEKVATNDVMRKDRLDVAHFDFQARKGRLIQWQITDKISVVGS
jgi:hypothetical protein